jgi:hypothetical protein
MRKALPPSSPLPISWNPLVTEFVSSSSNNLSSDAVFFECLADLVPELLFYMGPEWFLLSVV